MVWLIILVVIVFSLTVLPLFWVWFYEKYLKDKTKKPRESLLSAIGLFLAGAVAITALVKSEDIKDTIVNLNRTSEKTYAAVKEIEMAVNEIKDLRKWVKVEQLRLEYPQIFMRSTPTHELKKEKGTETEDALEEILNQTPSDASENYDFYIPTEKRAILRDEIPKLESDQKKRKLIFESLKYSGFDDRPHQK